jgi:hypothetical protein
VVVSVVDGLPDQQPVGTIAMNFPPENAPGNGIVEDIGGGRYVGYAHFKPGSIPAEVRPGARLRAGDLIGRVGNSGNSNAPHLHFQVADAPSLSFVDATGLPFVFDTQLLEGTVPTQDSVQATRAVELAWLGGGPLPVDRAGAGVRSEQMPARNGVFGYNLSSPRQSIHAGRRSSHRRIGRWPAAKGGSSGLHNGHVGPRAPDGCWRPRCRSPTPPSPRGRRNRRWDRHVAHPRETPAQSSSKRIWSDNLPAVALKKSCSFGVIHRVPLRKFFNETSSSCGGVEKQHAAGFVACILPGMRDVTRHERTGSRATDGYLVADLEGEFAGKNPGDLIAVVVQMMDARSARGQRLLEHHDTLASLTTEEL